MNTHVSPPPLDVATAVLAPVTTSTAKPPQDWEQLVSPGHVLRERLLKRRGLPIALGLAAFVTMPFIGQLGPVLAGFLAPQPVVSALTFDPARYVQFSSGVEGSYRLHWLAAIGPLNGMNGTEWNSLVEAVRSDIDVHGIDAASWTATAELPTMPRVTRPERVFEEDKIGALATGVVAIPEAMDRGSTIDLVGFVDGHLAWQAFSLRGCVTFFGPTFATCIEARPHEPNAVDHVMGFKPAVAAEI